MARLRPGNRWLRAALTQCAWAAVHTHKSYYRALYRRLVPRLGPQAALIAVAHSQLAVIWHLLTKNRPYRDLGEDYFQQLHAQRHKRNAVKKLERLGYKVILEPAA